MTAPNRDAVVEIMAKADWGDGWGFLHPMDQDDSRRQMRAALAAIRDAGYAVVPVRPTPEMLTAAGASPDGVGARGGVDWRGRMLPKYWTAMVTAGDLTGDAP